ncbi:MAG: rim15, signal transduction response regulator [Trizodia sp. TS-e1964]|nr:MAG: rim15, signal transduction response regulator [Trizodia sp. TS-e1964]
MEVITEKEASSVAPQPRNTGPTIEKAEMERSLSMNMREERDDLKEAAEQALNVILDLGLDGLIRWVSPSWCDVIGTPLESLQGRPISDVLIENKNIFMDAVESMKKDESRSQIVRFCVEMGPLSKLWFESEDVNGIVREDVSNCEAPLDTPKTIILEGQGIMVYDHSSGGESHTMWMIRPSSQPREITIDLPVALVESLGVGAEMLAQYLTSLAEFGANDPGNHAPPLPVLCRICERQFQPWWFEKHTELCLQEHKAEMEVQITQENLTEHRHAIVKVLDALEARASRPRSGELTTVSARAEYKGLPIGPSSTPSSGPSSGTSSPTPANSRSRESSSNGFGHARVRSFAVRRPQARIVELLLDLCDTALEISTPAIKEYPLQTSREVQTQSPQSESRLAQVLQWQSPSTNTLEQEQGLAVLCSDTEAVAKAKVDAVIRHRRIIEYAERIRVEFTLLVQGCIEQAIDRAARIEAARLSGDPDSGDFDAEPPIQEETDIFPGSYDGSSNFPQLAEPSEYNLPNTSSQRATSATLSTRSSSPKESLTPRSHWSGINSLSHSQSHNHRLSMNFESDAGDSDASAKSSIIAAVRRTESPGSEHSLSRGTSLRERNRRSFIYPGTASPHRQQSPSRMMPPASPLRITKPRLSRVNDSLPSPITSPLLTTGELSSPATSSFNHRRQSSTASNDPPRPPLSPRLTSVSHPQARAAPPSIKDFEIIKPISKGAFGSVYLSKKKSTGDYFAIKVLKKNDMVAKNQVTNVKAERAIMMWQGESEFVAKLYWTFASKDYLYLVMEYLNGGDCASLIKVLGGLSEDWAKKYLAEVVLGVAHLHGRGIVHRDLKPDNLLIDQKGHLKLTDFGLSRMGLIGRQKRALQGSKDDSSPDLLKNGPFVRPLSVVSSRSASFDLQGLDSPACTPHMTPDLAGQLGLPSYFSLSRESTLSRENSRRTSTHRSDSGGSDALNTLFRSFSLVDQDILSQSAPLRRPPIEEEPFSEGSGSLDPYPLHPASATNLGSFGQSDNPPQSAMMPPPLALFDPADNDRRFVGTPDYLAPETINGTGQDEKSDWWSLGCILFEFLYGYPPFHADTPDKVFENILNRHIDWPDEDEIPGSLEAKDLINKLLCIDPRDRLGANIGNKFSCGGDEVRNHPWFDGINWENLLQDEAQFVPAPENPEDTEYFDPRGASLQSFAEELEDQASSPAMTPAADYPERPYDALSRVRNQVNSMKRNLMPLHIPPHVRDGRSRRLSEPVATDDFGNFAFKNLPVLEKANKDVIQKLRAEALQSQHKSLPSPNTPGNSSPIASLEGSPILPMPLKRTLSASKNSIRPTSPSVQGQANPSPSRMSNPSSPLMLSFSAGHNGERRKTSSTSSSLSLHSGASLHPGAFVESPRLATTLQLSPLTSSPIKLPKIPPPPLQISPQKGLASNRHSLPASRSRSQTVGSQEGEPHCRDTVSNHHKRRSQVFDMSPSSSDTEESRVNALLRVQRRRQSSRRMSMINLGDGPVFRPLDVLICEDHPVSRMVMEKLLEKLRCRTITVANGPEAMRYAMGEVKFDIIMMEFKLPQINGADVARMIRDTKNANSNTPIVAVTGYLKELQDPHHFDALIEKPPTTSKLTEVMCKLCEWKAPPPRSTEINTQTMTPSGLRQESLRSDDSPSSVSSGFPPVSINPYHTSSREESIASSIFGDTDSIAADDIPIVIRRQATDDWRDHGLGISGDSKFDFNHNIPHLMHQSSAPTKLQSIMLERQRSVEKVKAKRESIEKHRHECAESGDDEDEELGNINVRAKSPQINPKQKNSKLGTEMMRTNSRGSIISGSEVSPKDFVYPLHPPIVETSQDVYLAVTPPEIFPPAKHYDIDSTPKRNPLDSSTGNGDQEETPRANPLSSIGTAAREAPKDTIHELSSI